MKNIYKYIFAAMLTLGTTTSCSDFLDEAPKGVIDEDKAFSRPDEMVTSAYAMLSTAGTLIRSTFGLTATCRQTIA